MYSVGIDTTVESLYHTYDLYGDVTEIEVTKQDIVAAHDVVSEVKEVSSLVKLLDKISQSTEAYITFSCNEYPELEDAYVLEVSFDGTYFGFELLVEYDRDPYMITLFNGLDYKDQNGD